MQSKRIPLLKHQEKSPFLKHQEKSPILKKGQIKFCLRMLKTLTLRENKKKVNNHKKTLLLKM
jgi:transcriptional regulator of met regulon